jgi:glycosyltransferase involved in cell wall biosynthesis
MREANIWGSPERLILGQINHLKEYTGIPVTYRRRGRSNPFAEHMHSVGRACVELNEFGPGDPRTVWQLVKLIRERRPILIVTHDFKSNLYGYLASMITGVKHVVHFHGFTAEGPRVKLYNAIDRAVMRRSGAVLTVAEQTRELLIARGVAGERIEVVINAVTPEAFETVTAERPRATDGRKVIVAAGRLSYEKGIDVLIEAAGLLKDEELAFDIQVFGDGPERVRLQALIDRKALNDSVHLAGFKADLRAVYAGADLLVIPSRSEAFPLVLLEAWAQGTPVVATPVGRLPELVRDGVNGLVAESVTPEALAKVLAMALRDDEFKPRAGRNGLELTREKYSFEAQAEALSHIYRRWIGSPA